MVRFLRSKFWIAVFFALISVGQAYPYSYAWSLSQAQSQCGCNLKGRKCVHGCKFRKTGGDGHGGHSDAGHHRPAETRATVDHSRHRHGRPTAVAQHGHHKCKAHGVWVNPDCSKQKERKVLSFQSDPFLVSAVMPVLFPARLSFALSEPISVSHFQPLPEVPPPRLL